MNRPPKHVFITTNRGQRDGDNIHLHEQKSRIVEEVMTNNWTQEQEQKPSPSPPTLPLPLQQPKRQINQAQATIEKKTHGIRQYRSRLLRRKGNNSVSNQESRKSNTQQHVRQQRGGQEEKTSKAKETRHLTLTLTKTRKTPGYTSSKLKKVSPMPAVKDFKLASNKSQQHDDLPIALQLQKEMNALIQESPKSEQPVDPTTGPTTFVGKNGNSVNCILIYELFEEAFFLCECCRDVLCQRELDEASEISVSVDGEMTGSISIYDPVAAENFREKTNEVIEFANALARKSYIVMYKLFEKAFLLCGCGKCRCSEVLCQGELRESEHSVQVDREITESMEEAFLLSEKCSEVLSQGELEEGEHSVHSAQGDREITESMNVNINGMPSYDSMTENFKGKTKELIEFTKALEEENFREKTKEALEFTKALELEEEAQIQREETKVIVEVEQEEVDRLNKLLPQALWMLLNNERRQELFTSDHIRSLIRLLDEDSFAKKSTYKRDDLLAELEKINDENPDLLQVAARLYL